MILYVDDFKLSRLEVNVKAVFEEIRAHIAIGPAHPVDQFLGVNHAFGSFDLPNVGKVFGRVLNNESFMKKCVETYLDLAPVGTKPG